METERYSQLTQQTNPGLNASDFITALDPKKDIDLIILNLQGLERRSYRDGGKYESFVKRINKPVFTDEFIQTIASDLRSLLNLTVQVSRFDDQTIKSHVGNYMKTLIHNLATHGDDHFISSNTWKNILEVHAANENGTFKSGWEKFGIEWSYDSPIYEDMLRYGIKDYDEETDQAFVFERLLYTIRSIVEASFNKSFSFSAGKDGMLVSAISQIKRESNQVVQRDEKPKYGGGMI